MSEHFTRLVTQYVSIRSLTDMDLFVSLPPDRSMQASWDSFGMPFNSAGFRPCSFTPCNSVFASCVLSFSTLPRISRDTTVKVWHVPTATEHKNLGGHTSGVTCLSAPPPEYCKKLGKGTPTSSVWAMYRWVMPESLGLVIIGAVHLIFPQWDITSADTFESSLSVWGGQPSIIWPPPA